MIFNLAACVGNDEWCKNHQYRQLTVNCSCLFPAYFCFLMRLSAGIYLAWNLLVLQPFRFWHSSLFISSIYVVHSPFQLPAKIGLSKTSPRASSRAVRCKSSKSAWRWSNVSLPYVVNLGKRAANSLPPTWNMKSDSYTWVETKALKLSQMFI